MTSHPDLDLMRAEMARQCADALQTLDGSGVIATQIADSIRRTGNVVLYAMGGSHYVNRIAEPLYRDLGVDARALVASEVLSAPLPDRARTALIVSQSGESGEIVVLLSKPTGSEVRFGLSLEPGSTLAKQTVASMIAAGGTENAFAATRSIILTVAMHAAVLEALGAPQDALRDVLRADTTPDVTEAAEALAGCEVVAFSGRHVMQGLSESGALSLMELSRLPSIGLEGGQFRHGPLECLSPSLGVVVSRSAGPDFSGAAQLAEAPIDAGCPTVMLDAGGGAPVEGSIHLALPANTGLAAATSVLLTLQRLNIAVALTRIPQGAGTPLRTTKVTR